MVYFVLYVISCC